MKRIGCLMVLVSAAMTATSLAQTTPIMQVFDIEARPSNQTPPGCLDELAAAGGTSGGRVSVTEGRCVVDGSRNCRIAMTLAVDGDNPKETALGSTCYSVELTPMRRKLSHSPARSQCG